MTLLIVSLALSATPDSIHHERSIALNDGAVRSVAISPDGRLVAGCGDRSVQLFDVKTGGRLQRLEGHTKPVASIAFAPDRKLLASASADGSIRLWDAGDATTVRVVSNGTRPHNPHPPLHVAFSPDGKTLVACYLMHRDHTQVVLYDVDSGRWTYDARQPRPEAPTHLAFSPDGTKFAVAKDSGNITLMDVVEFGVLERFTPPRVILFKSKEFPGGLDSTRFPLKHDAEQPVSHVAFSRNGKQMLSCGGDNTIRVWEPRSGKPRLIIEGAADTGVFRAAAFSTEDSRIISVTNREEIQMWDARNGGLLADTRGTGKDVFRLALSSDGKTLATCGADGVVNLWDISINSGDAIP